MFLFECDIKEVSYFEKLMSRTLFRFEIFVVIGGEPTQHLDCVRAWLRNGRQLQRARGQLRLRLYRNQKKTVLSFFKFIPIAWIVDCVDTKAKCRHLKKLTSKGTLRQVFIRVYRLEIQSVILVFSTQLCELLPL
jgi:hypothetical protein